MSTGFLNENIYLWYFVFSSMCLFVCLNVQNIMQQWVRLIWYYVRAVVCICLYVKWQHVSNENYAVRCSSIPIECVYVNCPQAFDRIYAWYYFRHRKQVSLSQMSTSVFCKLNKLNIYQHGILIVVYRITTSFRNNTYK